MGSKSKEKEENDFGQTQKIFNKFVDSMKNNPQMRYSLYVNGTTIDLGGKMCLISMETDAAEKFEPGKIWDKNTGGLYKN